MATVSISLLLVGCDGRDEQPLREVDGLSLYWKHEIFGAEGRRLAFEFYTPPVDQDYDLIFDVSREDRTITARLSGMLPKGLCPVFPIPTPTSSDPGRCMASGGFELSEKELRPGSYTLRVITPSFEVNTELLVADQLIRLEIPANDHLTSSIQEVYPMPKDLLLGSVVYQGDSNGPDAEELFQLLEGLGLAAATLPPSPYRDQIVDETGAPLNTHWDPDNHSLGILYQLGQVDFKTVFKEVEVFFARTNLNIYLYTSNGDEAKLSQTEGIHVVFAP